MDKYSDTFPWSYDKRKEISCEMVEHRILLITSSSPVRQEESQINLQLQQLMRAKLERFFKAGFIKQIETINWIFSMVLL